ncbi:MAG: hypothetical protein LBR09_02980 [Endomicrobium sp.]|nr:hypothetical protein [Endomicrobium sp.]
MRQPNVIVKTSEVVKLETGNMEAFKQKRFWNCGRQRRERICASMAGLLYQSL